MRPVTLMSAQWQDLPFHKLCAAAQQMGYDGIEIACGPHFDPQKAAEDPAYCGHLLEILEEHSLGTWAISAHPIGHCVGSTWDPRIDALAPEELRGYPAEIHKWAQDLMLAIPEAAKNMGVKVVTGFMGSPIWPYWYSYPDTSPQTEQEGLSWIKEVWSPIFDAFDEAEVLFAFEVHPTQIAFDYYTAQRLLEVFECRETLGFNFDPSHLIWQGVNPVVFLQDFAQRICHVHMKDTAVVLDGRSGLLGSFLAPGSLNRGWNFRCPGHGDIDFETIMRVLNQLKYGGPLSVEWEDAGMERTYGAAQACAFVRDLNFEPAMPGARAD